MYPTIVDSPQFQALIGGDPAADLMQVALEIARDARGPTDPRGSLDPLTYIDRVAHLARRVKCRLGSFPEPWLVVEAINGVLFGEEDYRGNAADYYDPRNSFLDAVMDRKLGIPISLSVLYMAVAERVALPLAGVNLPAHFVIRTLGESEPIFIDPFHRGRLLDAAGCSELVERVTHSSTMLSDEQLKPCGATVIVQRMLQNLKTIYLRQRRVEDAIPVLKRLTLLRPDHPEELRDLGLACYHGGRRDESAGYLEEYLRLAPLAEDAHEVRLLLRASRID